jgi:hypothetical protein
MKDPREYYSWVEWWCDQRRSAVVELYADICHRLDAKDAEIAELKEEVSHLRTVFGEIGRCPECGNDQQGCYCAEDAEAREVGEGE